MLLALYPVVFVKKTVLVFLECDLQIEDGLSVSSSVQIELTSTLTSSDELTTQGSNSVSVDGSVSSESSANVTATLSVVLED